MSDGDGHGQQSLDNNSENTEEQMLDSEQNRASVNSPWNVSYYA
jgi:hypothetical protein